MANSKEKNLSTENISEKDLMANLLNKVFKMAILKMLKELNEQVEKVKKMMSKQNENVNKELEKVKRNQKETLKKKCRE